MRQIIVGVLFILVVVLLLAFPPRLPPRIGQIDFCAYWSASYLLAHGENFADAGHLLQIERTMTTWPEDYTMFTWNPPWLLTFLIPFTWVPFERATWWWLLTNIMLVFVSVVTLWQLNIKNPSSQRWVALALLFAFAYSPTLTALIAGQVNLIVLAGLTGFLFFTARQRYASAGVALSLTVVKIHLVYLTVPLLLLDALRRRNWRVLAGFGGTLVGLFAVVVVLRPTFIFEYASTVHDGGLLDYMTPTLGGILALLSGWNGFKLMGLVIVPTVALVYWYKERNWDTQWLLEITLLISVMTAPFGWSYDFVVLLVPLMRIFACVVDGSLGLLDAMAIVLILCSANGIMFYQRITSPNEFYFFWVPILVVMIYFFAWARRRRVAYA